MTDAAERARRSTPSPAASSRRRATASISATALGHGIGLATHELPSLGQRAPDEPLPARPSSRSSPGIYLDGEMGVRIEDLVLFDAAAGRLERLTRFPREVIVVGG